MMTFLCTDRACANKQLPEYFVASSVFRNFWVRLRGRSAVTIMEVWTPTGHSHPLSNQTPAPAPAIDVIVVDSKKDLIKQPLIN
jgi:hypothetical protein